MDWRTYAGIFLGGAFGFIGSVYLGGMMYGEKLPEIPFRRAWLDASESTFYGYVRADTGSSYLVDTVHPVDRLQPLALRIAYDDATLRNSSTSAPVIGDLVFFFVERQPGPLYASRLSVTPLMTYANW